MRNGILETVGVVATGSEPNRHAPVEQCLLTLLEATPGVVMVSNGSGGLLYMNRTGRRMLGVGSAAAVEQRDLSDFYTARAYEEMLDTAIPTCLATGVWRGESALLDRHGSEIPVSQVLTAHRDTDLGTPVISSIAWDIREHKRTEQRLLHQATHDALTGLPNRALLIDRVTKAMQSAERHRHLVGLLFLDLNGFKQINDEHGHEAANGVLCELSSRLRSGVRCEDTVARYGGDEFVVLVPGLSGPEGVKRVVRQVRSVMAEPFDLGAQRLQISASVGMAIYPQDAEDAEGLIQKADSMMYAVKKDLSGTRRGEAGETRFATPPCEREDRLRSLNGGTRYRGVA